MYRSYIIVGVIFILFLACLSLFYFQHTNIDVSFKRLKLVPLPETFTELYFDSHTSLPTVLYPDQEEAFSFRVHNMENKDMTYLYEVSINADGKKQRIDEHSISLPNGGTSIISEHFQEASPAARSEVVVTLKNKGQQIDFWVTGGGQL